MDWNTVQHNRKPQKRRVGKLLDSVLLSRSLHYPVDDKITHHAWQSSEARFRAISDASRLGTVTYCVGVILDDGLIFASDSRTHAGVDNFASFSKLSIFEQSGERVIVLLSSGNLAGTQAVISTLRQNDMLPGCPSLMKAGSMLDVHYWSRRPCAWWTDVMACT